MNSRILQLGAVCLSTVLSLGCGNSGRDALSPSTLTGAEARALMKWGITSDDLHGKLGTMPAMIKESQLHWELSDGSMWTQFVPSSRGARIIGWHIESKSLNDQGGELYDFDLLLNDFYVKSDLDRVPKIIELGALVGMFDKDNLRKSMTAFFSQVFSAHPDNVSEWAGSDAVKKLNVHQRAVIYAAIADAKLEQSSSLLNSLIAKDPEDAAYIRGLVDARPQDLLEREIRAPDDLDALWSAFFATGDPRFIERICSVFSWDVRDENLPSEKRVINGAAAWSVESNAHRHPIVVQVCQDALPKADEVAKPIYEKILSSVTADTVKRSTKEN